MINAVILTMLVLAIQELGIPLHFFESSSISFVNVLHSYSTQVFHFLGQVFISGMILKDIFFLYSPFPISLLV